jgi:hypothetical protein
VYADREVGSPYGTLVNHYTMVISDPQILTTLIQHKALPTRLLWNDPYASISATLKTANGFGVNLGPFENASAGQTPVNLILEVKNNASGGAKLTVVEYSYDTNLPPVEKANLDFKSCAYTDGSAQ